jgi:polysaccharide chain length determinant protein (PEP-CTERM system associated)
MTTAEGSFKDKLDPVLGLLRRGRWIIISIATIVALAATAVLYQLPNRYTSEATLFVVEQQVPQRYVTPTSTTELGEALPAMTQEVLSGNRLLELVDQFDLFPSQRRHLAPEEVEALVLRYLTIEPLPPAPGHREANAFKISFTASRALLAQEVTSKLTSLFIQENLKTREDQARNTTNFLHTHLETAKETLNRQEELLRDFKMKYLGELPEQQQGNLAILSGAQLQLQNIAASVDRAQQQRVYLESLLSSYQRMMARGTILPGSLPVEPARNLNPYQAAQTELANLESARTKLLATFRPNYPDVQVIDSEIAAARARLTKLLASGTMAANSTDQSKPTSPSGPASGTSVTTTAPPIEEDSSIAQVRSQLESNRVEIANLTKDQERQRAVVSEYQSRLNLTPVREQQLASILRDYELSKQDYADLLGKEQQSELAMSLEKQQGGEQFRLVDPPSLPNLPSSPKRLKMSLAGVGGGLALGLIIAVLIELKKSLFHTERDVILHFAIPLVISLPLIMTRRDERRGSWMRALEWVAGTMMVAIVLGTEAWVYRHP